jgi:hypothetical protein
LENRYWKDCKISLATPFPELFAHLPFHEVFDLKRVKPIEENYLVFETIAACDDSNLVWHFMNHMLTNCVDFPSLCAFRMTLPIADKEVILKPKQPDEKSDVQFQALKNGIVLHPGKHWQSKTFPKDWWDDVITELQGKSITPIIIGADSDEHKTTVDVNASGCIDLRNKLSIMESVWLLQNSRVLLTNDSSPLHMAVTGPAWIGYVATCKRPDYITHWRRREWGWRMKNFGKGGMWDVLTYMPNESQKVEVGDVPEDLLRSWLPTPKEFAGWAVDRYDN